MESGHMGNLKIWPLVISLVSRFDWLVVVSLGFWYLTSSVFFPTPFNLLISSLSVKAAKELLKEGRKETKIPFKFQLHFWVSYGYSVARKCLPGPLEKQSHLPNKALKCTSRFWVLFLSLAFKCLSDMSSSYFLSGASGNCNLLNLYLFYFSFL